MDYSLDLSIIIVNWNSKDFVKKSVESVLASGFLGKLEIIVVDGGSFDGCDQMLRDSFPKVRFIQCNENVGFGRANNVGGAAANGELLLLLNPDTEVKRGSLDILKSALLSRVDIGLVGPKLLNSDLSLQTSCVQSFPTPVNQALDSEFLRKLLPGSSLWGTHKAFASECNSHVQAVSGACMLLRTELFRKLGGFRPEYFMYGEDIDLCLRINRLGLGVYHCPKAEVIHHGAGCSKEQVSQFSTIMMRHSNEMFMRINYGNGVAVSYRFLQAVSAVARLALGGIFGASARRVRSKWWPVLLWAAGRPSMSLRNAQGTP